MRPDLKEPLSFAKLFGVFEPTVDASLMIEHIPSIKTLLECFPVEYDHELTVLHWDTDECCRGWFKKAPDEDDYDRVSLGCTNGCMYIATASDIKDSSLLHLKYLNPKRRDRDVLRLCVHNEEKSIYLSFFTRKPSCNEAPRLYIHL